MKGGTRWLETWTFLDEKLWSHSWENLSSPRGSTLPLQKLESLEDKG